MAICGSPFSHWRGGGAVGVLDQFARRPCVAEAGVDGDVRIDAEKTAEREELIGADIVGLHGVPDGIEDGRPLIDVADAVAPLVCGDKVAAGKAEDAEAQLLERCDDLRTEAFNIVRGHERDRADMKGARACAGDLESGVVSVGFWRCSAVGTCGTRRRASRW